MWSMPATLTCSRNALVAFGSCASRPKGGNMPIRGGTVGRLAAPATTAAGSAVALLLMSSVMPRRYEDATPAGNRVKCRQPATLAIPDGRAGPGHRVNYLGDRVRQGRLLRLGCHGHRA